MAQTRLNYEREEALLSAQAMLKERPLQPNVVVPRTLLHDIAHYLDADVNRGEEILSLRRRLGIELEESKVRKLRLAFRLQPAQARVLWVLANAGGASVARQTIHNALYADQGRRDADPKTIDVYISHLRRRLGKGAIETLWSIGYRLTDEGRALCDGALTNG